MGEATTLTCELEVTNHAGMHTRVALLIFKTMKEFSSEATLTHTLTGNSVTCRSVLEMLSLGAAQGDHVILNVTGEDAESTQKAIIELFDKKFYEDEFEKMEEK